MHQLDFFLTSKNTTGKISIFFLSFFLLINSFLIVPGVFGQQENESSNFNLDYSVLSNFDYNRVDGVLPGIQTILTNNMLLNSSFTTRFGYGFKSKQWHYSIGMNHAFDLLKTKSISLTFFDETRSNDRNILSQPENILSTAFLRKDYRDYFGMRGFEAQLDLKLTQYFGVGLSLRAGRYHSLTNLEPWSLFSLDDFFRDNPPISRGKEGLTSIAFRYDSRDLYFIESNYWNIELKFENESQDFQFNGTHFLVERMQLGWGSQTLIANLRGGFRGGATGEQYLMDLGGIGTLRGYAFKEFTGSRMLRFEGNYLFNGDLLQKIPLQFMPFYSSMSAGIFFEAGMAWFGKNHGFIFPANQFPQTNFILSKATGNKLKDIKSNFGVSLLILDGAGKIDIAKRLDRSKDAWKFTFRFRFFQFL